MAELINQSMSNEADCRTAPATPGLLKMSLVALECWSVELSGKAIRPC